MADYDPTLPSQTRDGRSIRILATDAKRDHPIVALVTERDGTESVHTFAADGRFSKFQTDHDLVNVGMGFRLPPP